MPKFLTKCLVKIGGSNVPPGFMADVVEVVVDSSLHLPSMFTILVHDSAFEWVDDSDLLDIGKAVEIEITTTGGQTGTLIKGEITALEPDFSGVGKSMLLIRGYDKSHRLHRGKKTRTFTSQSDSGIVSDTIAGEADLGADVDATTVTYDWVLQNNQTNMEFLMSRAQRIGYQVYVADETLYFKKGDANRGEGPELKLGDNLLNFRPCWTATHQANKAIVRGWDGKGKALVESTVTSPDSDLKQGGMTEYGGATATAAFTGEVEAVVTAQPVSTVDEAEAIAKGLLNDISREFVEAEGECNGDPRVLAGYTVSIQGVGTRFSGTYFVTSATHVYSAEGYKTRFSITGRQPSTLSYLLDSGNGHDLGQGLVRGVVTGMVTNLADPDDLGRVKVKYTWLGTTPDGVEIESDWVRIATPMAGPERGFLYLPELNDEVLVAFEHGDVHRPYIVGMLWSSTDAPPKPNSEVADTSNGVVNERIIKSRSGHVIIFDDTDGAEQIIIRDKNEANEIVIDSSDDSMTIKCDGDLTIEAGGKVTITSGADMSIESSAKGTFTASGDVSVESSGGGANVKSASSMTIEGTAGVTVKNAAAEVALSGPTVNINKGALEVT